MANERQMAAHVAAAIGRTMGAPAAQPRVLGGQRPAAPAPPPRVHWPELPLATYGAAVRPSARKKQEKARQDATRVLGDFQVYGEQQYGQRLKQLMNGAGHTQERTIQAMIGWVMSHPTWKTKKNLGHQSQRRGAPIHPETQREVAQISTDMENWLTKKYG